MNTLPFQLVLCVLASCAWLAPPVWLGSGDGPSSDIMPPSVAVFRSCLAWVDIRWPSSDHWIRVLTLRDHNTRVVALGTTLLGMIAGIVGVFALLRKRALVGDVVGHASLPGIGIAFIVMEIFWPGRSRSMIGLLVGATLAGLAGVLCTTAIRRFTRIKEDAALSIVLSVFFGLGMVLFTVIQSIPTGNSAGLNKFIFGSAASMLAADARFIAVAAVITTFVCVLLFKELALVCFDEEFAAVQGWPTRFLDLLLMGLIVAVAEMGSQCVGLILVAAMMVIPAAAARFWSDRLPVMTLASAACGAGGAYIGVMLSAMAPRLAAGAIVILVCGAAFVFSLLFGSARGLVWKTLGQLQARRRIGRHDLLRAFYELLEARHPSPSGDVKSMFLQTVSFRDLMSMRSWPPSRLKHLLSRGRHEGLLEMLRRDEYRLTPAGQTAAAQAVRNHRLWELFLIHYASISPTHVDRDADEMEHVLGAPLLAELEELLANETPKHEVPISPHAILQPTEAGSGGLVR